MAHNKTVELSRRDALLILSIKRTISIRSPLYRRMEKLESEICSCWPEMGRQHVEAWEAHGRPTVGGIEKLEELIDAVDQKYGD